MAVYEGRWDCTACGKRGLLGRQIVCDGCGRARPEGVTFYLPGDEPAITDPTLVARATASPDWVCGYCGASNRADTNQCQSCNASRGESTTQAVREHLASAVPTSGDEADRPQRAAVSERPLEAQWPRGVLSCLGIGALGLVGLFAALLVFSSWRSESQGVVADLQWQRSIEIERYKTVTEEDWNVPVGGRVEKQWQAVHHTRPVLTGYKTESYTERVQTGTRTVVVGKRDKGNGFFEDITREEPVFTNQTKTKQVPVYRQDPVFQTRYAYQIERWKPERTEVAEGRDHAARWPETRLDGARERESGRAETYHVTVKTAKGKSYTLGVKPDEWDRLDLNQTVTLSIGFGDIARIVWDKPNR